MTTTEPRERAPRPATQPPRPRAPRAAKPKRRHALAWRQLLRPRIHLPLLLVVAAFALLLAWQARAPFALDLGSPYDDPYLTGFHDGETAQDTAQPFRWTQAHATLAIPGFGATDATLILRLQGARASGEAPPTITATIGNLPPTTLTLSPEPRDYPLTVPAAAFRDGALVVALDGPTYRPPGDRRDLGVVATRVELRDATAPGGLIAPPLAVVGLTLLAILYAYGACLLALRSPLAAALAGWATAIPLVTFALTARSMLARYTPALAAILSLGTLATALVFLALRWLRQRREWATSERALGGATLIAGGDLLALLIGMRHPLYRSSDLLLNVHRLEFVQRGQWVFTLALPGSRALEAPYPPLFYAAMLPFSSLIADKALLVEVTAALAIAVGALLTFALARHATGADAPALWATGVYTLLPITYGMASAGNFANLFGQGVASAYLVALILNWGRWSRPPAALALTVGLTLALLGHFGVFLSLLAAIPLVVLVLLILPARWWEAASLRADRQNNLTPSAHERRERDESHPRHDRATDAPLALTLQRDARIQALALAISFLVALALSWALYYHFHADLLLGHARDFLGGDTNARGGSDANTTFAQRLNNEWGALLLWWGWPALPLALAGSNLLRRVRRGPAATLTITWLATAAPFLLAALVAGLSVRFHLFVAPALAVVAGWALLQLWRSHRALGPLAALAITAFWLWQGLAYWADRVLHAYR